MSVKQRVLISGLALVVATTILTASLFSATQVASTGPGASTEQKLYFSQEILPDHVFYKAFMVMDRLQLETAPEYERIFMQVEYAHRRLGYAQELLDKQETELAITTLTKGEQYLHHAVTEANELNVGVSVRERLKKAVLFHSKKLEEIKQNPLLTDADRAVIDQILNEHQLLIGILDQPTS